MTNTIFNAKTRIAVYPGTFDPITLGHEDLVRRAAHLFDEVIVAVAGSTNKATLFTLEERVQLAKNVFADFSNVKGYRRFTASQNPAPRE